MRICNLSLFLTRILFRRRNHVFRLTVRIIFRHDPCNTSSGGHVMQPHQLLDRLVTMVKMLENDDVKARTIAERCDVEREKMLRYYRDCIAEIVKAQTLH